METAWGPLPEVWDLMAEKYNLSYVYCSEECGCAVYVNTDSEGRFFSDRYILDYFVVEFTITNYDIDECKQKLDEINEIIRKLQVSIDRVNLGNMVEI